MDAYTRFGGGEVRTRGQTTQILLFMCRTHVS